MQQRAANQCRGQMAVGYNLAPAKYSYRIAGRAGRNGSGLVQERTPLLVGNSVLVDIEKDANPVSPRRELELRWGIFKLSGKSSERQARDTTGLGVYSCRPDLPFVNAF